MNILYRNEVSIIIIIMITINQLKLLYTHFPVPTPFPGVMLSLPLSRWVLRSLDSVWCLWGCYGEASASGVLCQEEYDVDGFFLLTLGSPRASSLHVF